MRQKLTVITYVLVGLFPALGAAIDRSAGKGFLVATDLVKGSTKGYVPSQLWVYDEIGQPIAGKGERGAFALGERIALSEGWYLVEVGNEPAEKNRQKLFVREGKLTVVPTGLVMVRVEPATAQPRDTCSPWNGQLFAYLPLDAAPGPLIASNGKAKDLDEGQGVLQLAAGRYRFEWNRFTVVTEVRAGMTLHLETGLIGPMAQDDYLLHAKDGAAPDNPGLKLCKRRPTRVLVRGYQGSFSQPTSKYPYKKRAWVAVLVEAGNVAGKAKGAGPWEKTPAPAIRGTLYRGSGSEPIPQWEQEPITVPPPTVPPSTEPPPSQ